MVQAQIDNQKRLNDATRNNYNDGHRGEQYTIAELE